MKSRVITEVGLELVTISVQNLVIGYLISLGWPTGNVAFFLHSNLSVQHPESVPPN